MDRIRMLEEVGFGELVAGFLVPGLAIRLRGPKLWGNAALCASLGLLLLYIAWIGYSAANLALGCLISLHVSGFVYYCRPWLIREELPSRLRFTLLAFLAVVLSLYWPARSLVQQHFLVPLRLDGHVIVVRRSLPPQTVPRGDWIAYYLQPAEQGEAHNGGAVWIHGGIGLGPVLAVGGDTVAFSTNQFSVNGIWHTNLPYMPRSGGLVVREKHWFIWPNLAISGHGNVREDNISAAMMGLSDVSSGQYWGRPFRRWLWRKQILP